MGKNCCNCCRGKDEDDQDFDFGLFQGQSSLSLTLRRDDAHYRDVKNIYAYAVDAMTNFLGKPSYPFITHPKQLYPYILLLCDDLPEQEFGNLKEAVSDRKQLDIQLTIILKDARVIHPKLTEFSNIFCKLWITNGQEYLSSVKQASSYLLWEETFILDVQNYDSDAFHIEFWSSRPGFFEKLSSFHLERFKENDPLAEEQGMYFVGDAVEYVKSLPCVGQNMLWTIRKGPRRVHTRGQMNLYVQLGAKRSHNFLSHLRCHIAMIRLCYEKQVLNKEHDSRKLWRNWLEILPNTALTLIQQHALQHGITSVEQCLWYHFNTQEENLSVLLFMYYPQGNKIMNLSNYIEMYNYSWLITSSLKMRHEDRISFSFLRDVLNHLLDIVDEDSIGQMKEVLCKNIYDFSVYTVDMLRDLHKNFDVQNRSMADELYHMLRCITTTESKLCEIYLQAYEALETEASEWYLGVLDNFKDCLQEDDSIEIMGEGLKSIMKIYLKNQIILDDIFSRAWNVLYSCITYKKLDEVVCFTIQPMIKHLTVMLEDPTNVRKSMESLKMLQLYHTVRNLVNYMSSCIPTHRTILQMDEYSTWFGEDMVLEWFLLCDMYTGPFIQRAVLADSMERLTLSIVHGTSVPDVASIIDEMVVDVWMRLKWKDQFYTHGALLEAVKACVMFYNKSILEKIKLENFFCNLTTFDMNHKLCVALSNVYAMSEHLNKIKIKIKQELNITEAALGFQISNPMTVIQSELQVITAESFHIVFEKIQMKMRKFVKSSVKTKAENLNPGCGDVCAYIDNTLEMMYTNLKGEAFHIGLKHIWILVIKSLQKGLRYSQRCFLTRKRRINIFLVILRLLNQMRAIFFCDGHGLTHYEMENKLQEKLKCDLEAVLQAK